MYYVGKEFSPNDGGYKTLPNAKKAADKIGGNVYDDNGVIVYPEQHEAAETPVEAATATVEQPKEEKAEENTAAGENAENEAQKNADGQGVKATLTLTDDVPDGALDTNPDGSVNTYNANGEQIGTISAEEFKRAEAAAAELITEVHGSVTVVRDGLLAIRNAASWEDGHKCGICKTGYTVDVVLRFDIKGGVMYQTADGRFISGRDGDTVFNAAE